MVNCTTPYVLLQAPPLFIVARIWAELIRKISVVDRDVWENIQRKVSISCKKFQCKLSIGCKHKPLEVFFIKKKMPNHSRRTSPQKLTYKHKNTEKPGQNDKLQVHVSTHTDTPLHRTNLIFFPQFDLFFEKKLRLTLRRRKLIFKPWRSASELMALR